MQVQKNVLLSDASENSRGRQSFQVKKVHVEQIDFFDNEEIASEVLFAYFSKFGHIVDLKVLRNGKLKSPG